MATPTKHYGRWRIRWVDENGQRQSAVCDDFKTATFELRKKEIEPRSVGVVFGHRLP